MAAAAGWSRAGPGPNDGLLRRRVVVAADDPPIDLSEDPLLLGFLILRGVNLLRWFLFVRFGSFGGRVGFRGRRVVVGMISRRARSRRDGNRRWARRNPLALARRVVRDHLDRVRAGRQFWKVRHDLSGAVWFDQAEIDAKRLGAIRGDVRGKPGDAL